jgi:hypothetical protein
MMTLLAKHGVLKHLFSKLTLPWHCGGIRCLGGKNQHPPSPSIAVQRKFCGKLELLGNPGKMPGANAMAHAF